MGNKGSRSSGAAGSAASAASAPVSAIAANTPKLLAPLEKEGGVIGAALLDESHYSQAFHEILPENRIFLGDLSAAADPDNLAEAKITHNLNVLGRHLMRFREGAFNKPQVASIRYFAIDIADNASVPIGGFFKPVCRWIDDVLAASPDHRVLINCLAGVSRSATLTTAFIMHHKKLRTREALLFVQTKRTIICPNEGFMKALKEWEAHLFDGGAWRFDTEDDVLLGLLQQPVVDFGKVAERLGSDVHIDGALEHLPLRAKVAGEGSAMVVAKGASDAASVDAAAVDATAAIERDETTD